MLKKLRRRDKRYKKASRKYKRIKERYLRWKIKNAYAVYYLNHKILTLDTAKIRTGNKRALRKKQLKY